ncbi:aldose 1-epimerase [Capronia epimyces CBS 606.96]|uniref:Aldose 1-epimerase n=1 Tax=Capronia epimyces CBS 606.96 TaxID=1182542 RepID=W9YBV2_9EURO|nr:aldose 1-epimerase [Capronia epimyces CBS 606.96]EXJ89978.1 aldose 1-epimerase [Capronia epimyces CBS 606.96]
MASDSGFSFLPQGAIIQEFKVAGHNIVLGYAQPEPYATSPFFGETIGRVANRIKNAEFTANHGKIYKLAANEGPNHLHGGTSGWGKKTFHGPTPVDRNGHEGVRFTYLSPDGDEGYPGTVELRVWYTAWTEEEDGVSKTILETEYEVELVGSECEETVVNITNHGYFNITDGPTIEGTEVTLHTSKYLPVDETDIPLGTVEDFPGIEAGKPFVLGATEPDIDHCFIVDTDAANVPLDTRQRPLALLLSAAHPGTKLHVDVFSTEPSFQFYTGKYINTAATADSPARGPRAGFCVEPARYINAINVPQWRGQVLLKRNQLWGARTVHKAWKA